VEFVKTFKQKFQSYSGSWSAALEVQDIIRD